MHKTLFILTIARKEYNTVHTHQKELFFLTPTTSNDVKHIVKTLNVRNPTKIRKKYSKTITIPIFRLNNHSFVTGIFPESLKLASFIPVSK